MAAHLICRAFAQLDIVYTSALSEAEKPDKRVLCTQRDPSTESDSRWRLA